MATGKQKRRVLIHSQLFCALVLNFAIQILARSTQAGPPTFAAPPISSVAGSIMGAAGFYSMAKGDFNQDGIPDFATVGFACSNGVGDSLMVYIGDGVGGFRPPVHYPAGGCLFNVVTGRLRGTNAPEDLIMADEKFDDNSIKIALGNGNGTFQSSIISIPMPSAPTASAIGDFNGDGKADIAVALFGGSGETGGNLETLGILLGHGDGAFDAPVLYQSVNNPYGVAIGDFNNDGKIDIVQRNADALFLSLGNGDGTFLPGYIILGEPSTLITVTPPGPILKGLISFVVADFNEDENLDIAAQEDGARIDIVLGTGTGTFAPPVTYLNNEHQSGSGAGSLAAEHLTDSGHIDLVVSTGYGTTLAIFRGNGDGTFQSPTLYPMPQYDDESLILADVNSDGQIDIVTGTMGGRNLDPNFLTVLLNKGNGDFGTPPPLFSVKHPANEGTATNAVGVTLSDLTGNGKLDLVVTDWDVPIEPLLNGQVPIPPTVDPNAGTVDTHGTISVLAGNGDGSFQSELQYYVGGRPIAVQTADLTGNGKIDIVVVNAFDNQLSILKGNGDRTFQPTIFIPLGENPNALALADFNGDGKIDIAVTNLVDNNVMVLINQSTPGSVSFQTPGTYPVATYPSGIVSRDFNHDGKLDLAVVCSGYYFSPDQDGKHTKLSILLGNGDGTFAAAATQQLWNPDGGDAIAVADFGRGELDLAVAHFGNGELMIMRGNGDGTFTKNGTYRVGAGPEGIVAMDFNRDGNLDIAVNNLNDNTVTMLVGKGDGTFVPPVNKTDDTARPFGFATWGYPAFIAAGDLNGDGKPEIVTTHLFEAAATVLRNTSIPPVQLTSVVSRKIHGDAGTFDVDLPLIGGPGIECRNFSDANSGRHQIVATFAAPVTVNGSQDPKATLTAPKGGSVDTVDVNNSVVTVNLKNVGNEQTITLTLLNVSDGTNSGNVSIPMGVLFSDTTADGVVNAADITQTRRQSGNVAHGDPDANFREDVTADGVINAADITAVRRQSGTALPQ